MENKSALVNGFWLALIHIGFKIPDCGFSLKDVQDG
jgi:hypothetical protein